MTTIREAYEREYQIRVEYDRKLKLLEDQNRILINLLKEAQPELEWASREMCGREPKHWVSLRNKLRIYIEDLEK